VRRWKSLWSGPAIQDTREYQGNGWSAGSTWISYGLYALDQEDRAWTLCTHIDNAKGTRWLLVDELMGVQS